MTQPYDPSTARCKSCQAPIVWVKVPSGKAMPCDPTLLQVVTEEGETVRGRMSHFTTCPQYREWRRS